MSRILRALAVSVVATSAAIIVSAVVQNREDLSVEKLKEGIAGLKKQGSRSVRSISHQNRSGSSADVIDSLSKTEEEMLLSELESHV